VVRPTLIAAHLSVQDPAASLAPLTSHGPDPAAERKDQNTTIAYGAGDTNQCVTAAIPPDTNSEGPGGIR
jgi:hypothetical protein